MASNAGFAVGDEGSILRVLIYVPDKRLWPYLVHNLVVYRLYFIVLVFCMGCGVFFCLLTVFPLLWNNCFGIA